MSSGYMHLHIAHVQAAQICFHLFPPPAVYLSLKYDPPPGVSVLVN